MRSTAQIAQRELAAEVDQLAAELIRNEGLPLWQAIEEAQRRIQRQRRRRAAASSETERT